MPNITCPDCGTGFEVAEGKELSDAMCPKCRKTPSAYNPHAKTVAVDPQAPTLKTTDDVILEPVRGLGTMGPTRPVIAVDLPHSSTGDLKVRSGEMSAVSWA